MLKRYAVTMPKGVHITEYNPGFFLTWDVFYTPQDCRSGGFGDAEKIGTIKRFADNMFVVVEDNHPPLNSRSDAIWWIYEKKFGRRIDREGRF